MHWTGLKVVGGPLLLWLLATIAGCGKEVEQTPEQVAVAFFTAIYIDDDLDKARALTGPQLREVLDQYQSLVNIRRNLIVLAVDNPELTVMDTTADFFKKVATKARVQIHFKGTHDDRPREADRSVMVEKLSNGWKVVEIIPDRRKSGG